MSWNLLFHHVVPLFFLSPTTGPVFSGFDKIYSVNSFPLTKVTFPLLCYFAKKTLVKMNVVYVQMQHYEKKKRVKQCAGVF